jgi:hypothetical protein
MGIFVLHGSGRSEEPGGEKSSALILDPFSVANLVKISPACQENRGNREFTAIFRNGASFSSIRSTADTQPQLQPAFLRSSAMIPVLIS